MKAGPATALAALLLAAVPAGPAGAQSAVPCDAPDADPDADPWVVDFADRVLRYNGLAGFAVARWGDAVGCVGQETMEFDGARYGTLELTFAGGVTLLVETQPIETSIVTLRASSGFDDPAAVEAALRAYADDVGVDIDWSRPERSDEQAEATETFWDPEPGLNASAATVRVGERLVAVRFSMAL